MPRPEIGTVWVTENGDIYRLTDYRVDWMREPFTGEDELPTYSISYFDRGHSLHTRPLPADARIVWEPPAKNRCDSCGTDKLPPDTAFCGGCANDLDDEWMDHLDRLLGDRDG